MSRRKTVLFAASLAVVTFLMVCGCGGLLFVHLTFAVHSYEAAGRPTVGGAAVSAHLSPQNRVDDVFGERLVGPPYQVMLSVIDPSGRATSVRLHGLTLRRGDGSAAAALVRHPEKRFEKYDFVLLDAELGHEPDEGSSLDADLELFFPEGPRRGTVSFPLRPKSTRQIYIP